MSFDLYDRLPSAKKYTYTLKVVSAKHTQQFVQFLLFQCLSGLAAVFFQKHYATDANWDSLDDDESLWDRAVLQIIQEYSQPFEITPVELVS